MTIKEIAELWQFIVAVVSSTVAVIGIGAVVAWWIRGWLSKREIDGLNAEIRGLSAEIGTWKTRYEATSEKRLDEIANFKARCEMLNDRVVWAEDKNKHTATELATVKAQLATAEEQLKAHEPAETIAGTIQKIQTSTAAAISSTDEIGRMLKTDVKLSRGRDIVIK